MRESVYRQMIEDSPRAYLYARIIYDDKRKCKGLQIETINKSCEELFNVKSKNIIGKNIMDIIQENIIPIWLDALEKTLKNNKHTIERYVENINLNYRIDIYNDDNEHVYIGFNKISEALLKLPISIRRAPFIAWIKDIHGRYVDVNEKFLDMENVKYSDIIGKTDYYIISKERADRYTLEDKEVIRENIMYKYKDTVEYSSGKRYYEVTKWPYIDEASNMVLGSMGICVDMTNEVELIKNMERSQEIFMQIVNNIEDVIIIRDEQEFIYISPKFEEIYGVKPKDINLYEDPKQWAEYWYNVEVEKEFEEYNFKGTATQIVKINKSGEDKWLYTKYVPLFDEDGNITRKVGIVSNITNIRRMEKEIEKLRMDFFANLSHELRTPINLVLSSLQVLDLKMDKLEYSNFEYFDKYLSIIKQNGFRLLKLVNNLIDTTKLDAGHFSYNPHNNDIISSVEDICMSVSEFINNNKLNLIFDTDKEEKIISFDQDNIERIMLNLISNAIKFNKPNGEIKVTISCEDNIKITVKDTGIGIPQDKLESVFGRFEQVKSKLKKEKEGSGIGLSLVKSLVEMHDGDIYVKSKLGEGSEFIITLPDILIESEEVSIAEACNEYNNMNNINNMNIEFSDIYI